eukprot:31035-Pelagococcus_subviridis.AAC.2
MNEGHPRISCPCSLKTAGASLSSSKPSSASLLNLDFLFVFCSHHPWRVPSAVINAASQLLRRARSFHRNLFSIISATSHALVSASKNSFTTKSNFFPPPLPSGPLMKRTFFTVTGSAKGETARKNPLNTRGAPTRIICPSLSG